jgi:hypothetical protein
MMVRLPRTALLVLLALLAFLAFLALPATAQTPGLPVYGGGFAPGVEVGAAIGFLQVESRPGDGIAYGTSAGIGFSRFGITGTVARFDPSGANPGPAWAYGLLIGIKLVGEPLSPLAIYALGGAGTLENQVPERWFIPAALAATLTIPTPFLSIKPWLAPRLDIERTSLGGSTSSNEVFGLSAGVDLTLLSGLSVRASYDYVKNYDPFVAFGAAFHF